MPGLAQLPEDVLLQALARLPFPFVLQARLVCKQWLALLSSRAFSRLWPAVSRAQSGGVDLQSALSASSHNIWLLCQRLLSPAGNTTTTTATTSSLIFSSITQPSLTLSYPLPAVIAPANYRCKASSDGVILIHSTSLRQGEIAMLVSDRELASPALIYLLNPVTGRQIRLPFLGQIIEIFSMCMSTPGSADADLSLVQRAAAHFYVISCGEAIWYGLPEVWRMYVYPETPMGVMEEKTVAELYDSATGLWRLLPPLPHGHHPAGHFDFVWWSTGQFSTLASPHHVLTYHVDTDLWSTMKSPTSLCNIHHSTLHALKGCLFMEGIFQMDYDDRPSRSSCIGVATFDPVIDNWLQVSLMPDACAHHGNTESLLSHAMYKSFSDTQSGEIFFLPNNVERGDDRLVTVVYLAISRSWTCKDVSNIDQLQGSKHGYQHEMKGFTFRPSFAALSTFSSCEASNR
ncbi:hypothetical protein L7F22_003754 [Adiantum nelumboides]|nr:hypothetical protein [Adiantum nelumboides]